MATKIMIHAHDLDTTRGRLGRCDSGVEPTRSFPWLWTTPSHGLEGPKIRILIDFCTLEFVCFLTL